MAGNYTRGLIYTLLTQGSLLFIGVLSSVVVVRVLGPEHYGLYAYISLILAMAMLFSNFRLEFGYFFTKVFLLCLEQLSKPNQRVVRRSIVMDYGIERGESNNGVFVGLSIIN